MKISRKINGLYRSTKAIMVICAILLVVTAASLLMLMLNPIQPKEPEVIVLNRHAPVQIQHTVPETEEPETTEPVPIVQPAQTVHTLSTWSANVNGFKQNFAGFNQQELGITTPEPFPLRTTTKKAEGKKVMEAIPATPKTEISMVNPSEARPTEQTVTQALPVVSDDAV